MRSWVWPNGMKGPATTGATTLCQGRRGVIKIFRTANQVIVRGVIVIEGETRGRGINGMNGRRGRGRGHAKIMTGPADQDIREVVRRQRL